MAGNNSKPRETDTTVRVPQAPSFRLPTLKPDQREYLSRIQEAERNPNLDIPLGGPRNRPAW